MKNHIRTRRYYLCRRRLPCSGRAEKYHISKPARIEHSSYYSVFTEKMVLTDYIVKAFRTYHIRCF
jgi:hypothetical protein